MTSLNQLLTATDLSSSSLHAVDRGFLIASETAAKYAVLHALGLDALAPLHELLGEDASAVSNRITDQIRATLSPVLADPSRNCGVAATLLLEPGRAVSAISARAEASNADLILVGAHGKGFLQRFLLGSAVSRLLRTSKQSVLVVKEPCRAPYRRILVAVDFSLASNKAIALARKLSAGAELVLLHVFDVPFEAKLQFAGVSDAVIHRYRIEARETALRKLHVLAKSVDLPATAYNALVRHGDAAQIIVTEEEHCDCDLIVMGKHGTNVTEEYLLGSVTRQVLAASRSDVLVVMDPHGTVDSDALDTS